MGLILRRGHGDYKSLLQNLDESNTESRPSIEETSPYATHVPCRRRIDRKKLLPSLYSKPECSFPTADARSYQGKNDLDNCLTSPGCGPPGTSEKRSADDLMDHPKDYPARSFYFSDDPRAFGNTKRVDKMPNRRSTNISDDSKIEREECIRTACSGNLDYCNVRDGNLSNEQKKTCKMCVPRAEALILEHCKSTVKIEKTSSWTVFALIACPIVAVILWMLIGYCREHRRTRRVSEQAAIELNDVSTASQTCDLAVFEPTAQRSPWNNSFHLPSTRGRAPMPRNDDGPTDERLTRNWTHRYKRRQAPNPAAVFSQGIIDSQRARMEGERNLEPAE